MENSRSSAPEVDLVSHRCAVAGLPRGASARRPNGRADVCLLEQRRGEGRPESDQGRVALAKEPGRATVRACWKSKDGCRSGLTGSPGKRVGSKKPTGVRIPPHPPAALRF